MMEYAPRIPPYGDRTNWQPKELTDFGQRGAFPEVLHAQYPLGMGLSSQQTSNTLPVRLNGEGRVQYQDIASRGHSANRVVKASFQDLIPIPRSADVHLARPSVEEIDATRERTAAALAALVAPSSRTVRDKKRVKSQADLFEYTASNQRGFEPTQPLCIIKVVNTQSDPVEPPKWKITNIPQGHPSPPAPVLHSPLKALTAEEQAAWKKLPPAVSNWKNSNEYAIPLDKRLTLDGKRTQEIVFSNGFASLAESLASAERLAQQEVTTRAKLETQLVEKEKQKEDGKLLELAEQARKKRRREDEISKPITDTTSEERRAYHTRTKLRSEQRKEHKREFRWSRMGVERRVQKLAQRNQRDVSKKVTLNVANTAGKEPVFNARLFNRSGGVDTGVNQGQPYDKPLFVAQDAISSIYRHRTNPEAMDNGDLRRTAGPVQFEKSASDILATKK
ncbi:hypothetical protein EJ08DRAFT_652850 [Tothia fuscella]|uniref:Pre-mRNA-processing protein 45 n=1 Tax=Tothia fuscella TaxID=1048955 RepID=A0A9P4NIV0_9PEZI|nr:hypothetical protein EJ08DRAFT_652850 [Tothia fuscella]